MGVLSEYRHGALHVVATVEDKTWIDRQLKRIDERLFCEKQIGFDQREVWCVIEDTGERHGPDRFVTVYEFRGPDGEPVPYLHQAIVDEMQRRAKDGSGNILHARAIAERRNRDRLEHKRRETDAAYADIGRDFERHRGIGHFAVVPRSQQLMLTRARVREQKAARLRTIASAVEIAAALDQRRARSTLTGSR